MTNIKSLRQGAFLVGTKNIKEVQLPNNFNINELDLQGLVDLYNINNKADVYLNNTLVNKNLIKKSIRNRLEKMAGDKSVIINVDCLIGSPYHNMVAIRAIIADEYTSSFTIEKSDGREEYYSSWAAKKNYNPFTHKWDITLHAEIEEEVTYKYYSKLPQFSNIFITSDNKKVLSAIKMKHIKYGKLVNPYKETEEQKENRIHEFLMNEVAVNDHNMNKVVEEKDYNKLFNIFGYNMFISKKEELIEFVRNSIKFPLPEITDDKLCHLCNYILEEYDTDTLLKYLNLEKLDLYYEYVNDIQVGKEELLDALLLGEDIEDEYYVDILDDEYEMEGGEE
jgi:hypothetical protein